MCSLTLLIITSGARDNSLFGVPSKATNAFLEVAVHCKGLQKLLLGNRLLNSTALQAVAGMSQLQHLELHVPCGTWRRPTGLASWLTHVASAQQLTQLVLRPVVEGEAGAWGLAGGAQVCCIIKIALHMYGSMWCMGGVADRFVVVRLGCSK